MNVFLPDLYVAVKFFCCITIYISECFLLFHLDAVMDLTRSERSFEIWGRGYMVSPQSNRF